MSLKRLVGKGGILSWGMIEDQRGMLTNVSKKVGGGGWHFELGDDGGSQGNGDQCL